MFRSARPVQSPRPAHRGTTSWSGTAFYGSATAVAAGLALATTSLVPAAASDEPVDGEWRDDQFSELRA